MRGPDKFRQIWLTVRLPLFLQKDKLAGQTIAAAACETIGSNPGTPSPYLFCYRLSCRSTRHNSYAAPSVFRNCRKTRSRSSPSSAAATSASRRWSICSQVAAAWPKFRHPGQDAAYQPFPHQRQLVSGRSARLRLRPHIENPTRRVRQNHHRLRTPMRTDALPVRAGRFPTGAPEDRLRFIEMLGREGIPFGIVFTKTTNCRPHSSHAASNATNKCSVNSGRGCLRCSAPRAKNGRAAKRSWTSSANV